jgi:protein-S-isoprenylcysteine O-methyltransferase Ste14
MEDVRSSLVVQGSGPMAKALSIAGMIVAGLFVLIFGADLILKVPFSRKEIAADVGFLVSSLILAYLSWNAFRDSR